MCWHHMNIAPWTLKRNALVLFDYWTCNFRLSPLNPAWDLLFSVFTPTIIILESQNNMSVSRIVKFTVMYKEPGLCVKRCSETFTFFSLNDEATCSTLTWGFLKTSYLSSLSSKWSLFSLSLVQPDSGSTRFSWSSNPRSDKWRKYIIMNRKTDLFHLLPYYRDKPAAKITLEPCGRFRDLWQWKSKKFLKNQHFIYSK